MEKINIEKALVTIPTILQVATQAHGTNNIAMKALLNHYAQFVEKMTGTPASETIAIITAEVEKDTQPFMDEWLKKLNDAMNTIKE